MQFQFVQDDPSRQDLLDIYQAGLQAVHGRTCVRDYLSAQPMVEPIYLISIGKAAVAMAQGAVDVLGNAIYDGLVITKQGYAADLPFTCIEAAHPIPDESSLRAGEELLMFIRSLPHDAMVLFLLSGGASSLVEILPEEMDLDDLQQINRWLLASGLPINVINQLRSNVSLIKQGGLLHYFQQQTILQLAILDIPDGDITQLGSGLLFQQARCAWPQLELPVAFTQLFQQETVRPLLHNQSDAKVSTRIVADIQQAMLAARLHAEQLGYEVHLVEEILTSDAEQTAGQIIKDLQQRESGIFIYGGETTVTLPEQPGRGGRNQHLALAAANALAEMPNCYVLAAGTDGSDGSCHEAGALVDSDTKARGEAQKLQLDDHLKRADSGSFLLKTHDVITTGPTGSNVMDLVITLKNK